MRTGVARVLPAVVVLATCLCSAPVNGAERELNRDTPPASAGTIATPIQRVFVDDRVLPALFPAALARLRDLGPFFADSRLTGDFRNYYLYKDRESGILSEAWATSLALEWRSGWFRDALAVEVAGFTGQRLDADEDRDFTGLLAPGQGGYAALGILNAKLRHRGFVLTAFRQYLDLPYVNRQDSRLTPNTFEALTLALPEGPLQLSAGYAWKIKRRTSEEFESMSKALGLDRERGLAHAGLLWNPHAGFHAGAIAGTVPDVFAGLYGELGLGGEAGGWETRLDMQFTYQWDVGDDLLGALLDDAWNAGLRGAISRSGIVLRAGVVVTGSNASVRSLFGTNPTYVDLMQRSFNRPDEKALLLSASWDLAALGAPGLSLIGNFVAGFDGDIGGSNADSQELDLTLDYRARSGTLNGVWIRLRGSVLNDDAGVQDGADFRVIVRYDFTAL